MICLLSDCGTLPRLLVVQVWFRQGVNGDKLFWDAKAATGTAWVLMVGDMDHIAVSPNDQVVIVWV
jgi:hypothetical protein